MPITPSNLAKNIITTDRISKGGVAIWGDTQVKWGSTTLSWGSPFSSFINLVKNTFTPSNQTKH